MFTQTVYFLYFYGIVLIYIISLVLIVIDFSGYYSIGCYKDRSDRAIQSLEGKHAILNGHYSTRRNAIAKCAVAAMRAGSSMFAVQHSGQCLASSTAPQTYNKYGNSSACSADGEGGHWANQVYQIKGMVHEGLTPWKFGVLSS